MKGSVNPLCRRCQCGHFWFFNRWDYVKMILFGGIIINCPKCHRQHKYKLIYHAVEIYEDTKKENSLLAEGKNIVWRHG